MIHDMCRMMRLPMDTFDRVRGESESVGGLVLNRPGIPRVNTEIPAGLHFCRPELDNNRVKSVKVTMKRPQ